MEDEKNYHINMFNLLTSLQYVINQNDESDTDAVIARYLLTHLKEIREISIYKIAEDCYTSRSSVQRFIKNIGYESFTDLKSYSNEAILHQERFVSYTDHVNFTERLTDDIAAMMPDIAGTLKEASFRKLLKLFHEAEKVYFLTAEDSSFVMPRIQQEFLAVEKLVRFYTSANCDLNVLGKLGKKDLLIVTSVTGNFALAVDQELRDLNVQKALLTLNTTTKFEKSYDLIHYLGKEAVRSSRTLSAWLSSYSSYGIFYFFDLFFHEYYVRYRQ